MRSAGLTMIVGFSVGCAAPTVATPDTTTGVNPTAEGTSDTPTTGGTTNPSTTVATDGPGTSGTTIGETNPDDTADDTPLFDVQGVEVDLGGKVPFVGIPQTCGEALSAQSTVGCSFHAAKLQNFTEQNS